MDIGYNANYVLDLLKHIETDEVIFDLNTPTTAAIVYPSKQMEGEEMLMLLMPVRLND
jgi:DNA polymerase-3 subunit beta